jgi:hypothetical protein
MYVAVFKPLCCLLLYGPFQKLRVPGSLSMDWQLLVCLILSLLSSPSVCRQHPTNPDSVPPAQPLYKVKGSPAKASDKTPKKVHGVNGKAVNGEEVVMNGHHSSKKAGAKGGKTPTPTKALKNGSSKQNGHH